MLKQLSMMEAEMDRMKRKEAERTIQFNDYKKKVYNTMKNNLWYQFANFEATYMKIISNEQEIIRFINHGKDILIKSSRNDNSNNLKIIDIVEKRWLKIRETLELGRTRINTCNEKCKKFYGAQEKFLSWLERAENQI